MDVFHRSPWGQQIHECAALKASLEATPIYPQLITEIYFDVSEKTPVATNGADLSQINFCPFCGTDLKEAE